MSAEFTVSLDKVIKELSLEVIHMSVEPDTIFISSSDIDRPGLELTGYLDFFDKRRIMILGYTEYSYLGKFGAEQQHHVLSTIFNLGPPAVIITRNMHPTNALRIAAEECGVPLLRSAESTSVVSANLISYLNAELAPRITRHGVLVEVYGEGCLITGDSGVGKSETAIELIKRGHRLVADDAVEIRRTSKSTLVGTSPENIRHFIELRGIGIINARRIFGMGSIKQNEKIDMVINMEIWNPNRAYDRMGLDSEYTEILGVNIPVTTIPVRPGRNLSMIIEVAAMNNRQKKMGYNAAQELLENLGMSVEEDDFHKIKVDTSLSD
ncbi:MAG: HPr(Ser) kinase/phosphatase [Ruminococcus sp.]|nr:HPr(Ser) kinase/phosphatase [Ruminococcus sp.]